MVKQGDIIKINFDPKQGSEQSGFRPAIVISNKRLNKVSNVVLVCPITNSKRNYPSHVKISDSEMVSGEVMCEQIKALYLSVRDYETLGKASPALLNEVMETVKYITEIV